MNGRAGTGWGAVSIGLLCLGAGFSTSRAATSAAEPVADSPGFGTDSHERYLLQLGAAETDQYGRVLQQYSAYILAHPEDVTAALEKCKFIDTLADTEDLPVESAQEDKENCEAQLRTRANAGDPRIQLYLMEQQWGAAGIAAAEALLPAAKSWPNESQAKLLERLAVLYTSTDKRKSGAYAVQAVALDARSSARMMAAQHLVTVGAKSQAVKMLESGPPDLWNSYTRSSAAKMLLELDDPAGAARLLRAEKSEALNLDTKLLLARALAKSGDGTSARGLYDSALKQTDRRAGVDGLRDYFQFERDHGTVEQARATYERLRDQGYAADPFGRYRISLASRDGFAPWHLRDALGILSLALVLGTLALIPAVALAPVHYRGLARQLRGDVPPAPPFKWDLGHAWYALGAFLVVNSLSAYVLAYPEFQSVFAVFAGSAAPLENRDLGNALVLQAALMACFTAPLLLHVDVKALFRGQWSVLRTVLVGVGVGLLIRVALTLVLGLRSRLPMAADFSNGVTRALEGIDSAYGPLAVLALAGVAVPILEEVIFRGVLLNAMSRHVSFWWAAATQAVVFALMHESWKLMPFFFAFAMLAAWLYRRSKGLLAPICLHATNNLLVSAQLIMITRTLNA